MKILSLHLTAFSHFTNKVLDLSRGKEGLHIIFGPNEAGKSSSLRALRQALFGIPSKSADNFRHAHPDMRIGITLRHSDGTILKAVRRKGNSKTLRNMDKETECIEASVLQRFLGNINQSTFESMFGIDHATLVSGGEAILKGSGELGQLLFSTGSGIANLKAVQENLEKELQELYVRAGSTRRINKQLTEYAEAKKTLRDSELPSSEWERHDQALKVAIGRKQQLEEQLHSAEKSLAKLKRLRDAIPLIAERSLYLAEAEKLSSIPLLPEGFTEDARAMMEQATVLLREQSHDEQKLALLVNEIGALTLPDKILEQSNRIEALQQSLGSHQKAATDKSGLLQNLEDEEERAKSCLRDLGKQCSFEEAQSLRLSVQEKTRLRNLALERKALWQANKDAEMHLGRINERLEQCRVALSKLDKLPEIERLAAAFRAAQQDPQIEHRCSSDRKELERNYKQILLDLRKLGVRISAQLTDSPLSAAMLADLYESLNLLCIPDLETIEKFEREIGLSNKNLENAKERLSAFAEDLRQAKEQLQAQSNMRNVPEEADLAKARALRERGWQLIRKAWKESKSDSLELESFCKLADGSTDLETAYEHSVQDSDQISDRLRVEADAVARKAQLLRQIKQLQERNEEWSRKIATEGDSLHEKNEAWRKLWLEISDRHASPTQAKMWRPAFQNLIQSVDALITDLNKLILDEAKGAKIKSELVREMKLVGAYAPALHESSELLEILPIVQDCLEKIRSSKQAYAELEKEFAKLSSEQHSVSENQKRSVSELNTWSSSWEPAVASIGLHSNTTPEEITAFLDRLDQFFTHFEQISSYNRRISAIHRDAEKFQSDVFELAAILAPDIQPDNPERIADELYVRLKKAKEMFARKRIISEQLDELKEAIAIRKSALTNLSDKKQRMMHEAQVGSEDELIEAAKKSEQRRRVSELLDNYNRQLVRISPDCSLESLLKDCSEKTIEVLNIEIPALEQTVLDMGNERDQIQVTIGSELQIIKGMDGTGAAADSAVRVQQILAELGQDVEQYGRLKLASQILKKSIERYREKHQSPILKRASDIFARLTNNNFAGLQEDFNEKGDPVLFGVRADSGSLTPIEGMSEGTCDQVYLSLRLASLSLYLDREEALPFIVDDILVNFDDQRSLATLRVLAEFSKRTQVIMFTHHQHIVELAHEHLDPELVFSNSLIESAVPGVPVPKQTTLSGLSLTS